MSLDNLTKSEMPVEIQEALDRAYTLEADENLEEALRVCDAILAIAPELAEAHNLRGIILEQTRDKEEALEAYRAALKLDPSFDDAKQNLLDLEEDILETRYQAQRPNPLKVMVWGAIAYGVCFGLAEGLSDLMMFPLSRFSSVLMLLSTSLHAFGSGIGAFVIGRLSRFKESLLLGFVGVMAGSMGWTGMAIVNRIVYMFFPMTRPSFEDAFRYNPPLLRYAVIGAMTGLGLGIVQKTQRQMIRSIFAGIVGFGLYALVLPIFNNAMFNLAIDQFIPEGIGFELGYSIVYAFADFIFGCVLGSIIGALFGWVVAHNPVQNLRVIEDRIS